LPPAASSGWRRRSTLWTRRRIRMVLPLREEPTKAKCVTPELAGSGTGPNLIFILGAIKRILLSGDNRLGLGKRLVILLALELLDPPGRLGVVAKGAADPPLDNPREVELVAEKARDQHPAEGRADEPDPEGKRRVLVSQPHPDADHGEDEEDVEADLEQ